jgi:hypothetical protein
MKLNEGGSRSPKKRENSGKSEEPSRELELLSHSLINQKINTGALPELAVKEHKKKAYQQYLDLFRSQSVE